MIAWLAPSTLAAIAPPAIAFIVAGFAFLGYGALTDREASARRIDSLRPGSRAADLARNAGRRAMPVFRARSGPAVGTFERELGRRFNIPAERVARLILALRLGLGALLASGLPVAAIALDPHRSAFLLIVFGAIGMLIGFFLPKLVVSMLASKRQQAVERGLPEAIELLIIAVEAGLALDDAIDRIVTELRTSRPVVAEELALTSADLKILPSREQALANFAERADLPSVRSVVNTLSQTMRYGTPLAQALRVVADELRSDALFRLEERANKMPVLLTIPMVAFILPSLFLIIGGPAVLKLVRTLFH